MALFIILLILALWLLWPQISRWIRNYTAGKAEDMLRRMAGMPTRGEEKKARREAERMRKQEGGRQRSGREYGGNPEMSHEFMKKYAVDAEFTEIKEYSESVMFEGDGGRSRVNIEEQVSDAEYVVIKDDGKKA